jgi:signal transduction histidine kinase
MEKVFLHSSRGFQILQSSEQFNKISIGMAFCKRIVEKHLGTIVAKSVKGAGVGFTVFFPINQSSES